MILIEAARLAIDAAENDDMERVIQLLSQAIQEPDHTEQHLEMVEQQDEGAAWQGLTDEEMFSIAEIAWRHGWASCRDAEYIGEEAEDERWGMVGAEVVQDIARAIEAKLKEKNT